MTHQQILDIINGVIAESSDNPITIDSSLVGPGSIVDSMGLVQICLALEEEADKINANFDWTSEKAMSQLNSIFKTPRSLCENFNLQTAVSS